MHKVTTPIYAATDGSLHDTAHKASAHEAKLMFDTMFNQYTRDGDNVPTLAMSVKWREILVKLVELDANEHKATDNRPIPDGVYYSREHDNFYSIDEHKGQGNTFYKNWGHRWHEFPGDPRIPVDDGLTLAPTC